MMMMTRNLKKKLEKYYKLSKLKEKKTRFYLDLTGIVSVFTEFSVVLFLFMHIDKSLFIPA